VEKIARCLLFFVLVIHLEYSSQRSLNRRVVFGVQNQQI